MKFKFTNILLTATLIGGFLTGNAEAVVVPPGTELDPNQILRAPYDEPTSLDPHKANDTNSSLFIKNMFETLARENSDGEIIPAAATSWEHNDNFTVWTFHLRKEAKWSNGEPVTAKDFVYAWQRLADPKTAAAGQSLMLQTNILNAEDVINGKKPPEALGIKALDDYTLEITLQSPLSYFIKVAANSTLAPLYKPVIDTYGDKWVAEENMVVNGAFKLISWKLREKLILEPNPYYWDKNSIVLKQVQVYPIADANTIYNLYRAGNLDIGSIPKELYERDKDKLKDEIVTKASACTTYIGLNLYSPKLQDVRVRTALKYAFNREVYRKLGKIPAKETYTFTPSSLVGFHPPRPAWSNLSQEELNEKARALLKEAGYNKEHPLELEFAYTVSPNQTSSIALQAFYKKAFGDSIKITLSLEEWKVFLDRIEKHAYDFSLLAGCATLNDASDFLIDFVSTSPGNKSGYKNPEVDKLFKESLDAPSDEARNEIYYKIEEILDKDTAIIPVAVGIGFSLFKPYVKVHIGSNPLGGSRFADYYIIKH